MNEAHPMGFLTSQRFRIYFLPGFIFQSVIIAGGYGTGREIIEYFLKFGPLGGLMGMVLTSVFWSVILAISFEFARQFQAYDYRTFFKSLLGRFWVLFEILYILYLFIVLAVIGSAAGVLLRDNFGIPYWVGVALMLLIIGYLTFRGSLVIEKFLALWSFVLYGIYALFLIVALSKFGSVIGEKLSSGLVEPRWALGAFKYAVYNLGNITAVLFCLTHIRSRKQALTSGFLAGLIGIIPGLLFYIAVVGQHPEILTEEIPAVFVLAKMGVPFLLIAFQIVLFGTLLESGTAFIHSVNERLESMLKARGKGLDRWKRPLVAGVMLTIALAIAGFGIIDLIAKGYGTASWGFFILFILPLLTLGIVKILKSVKKAA